MRRAEKYIRNVLEALKTLELSEAAGRTLGKADLERLLDAVERYVRDAQYYLDLGDHETALAAASYAEGLLDALKYLGVLEPRWPSVSSEERRVVVGGTFDLIHPGHVELLRYASTLGKVYAIVARDSTVVRLKGRRPVLDEESRLKIVASIRYVYRAVLGDERDMLKPVEDIRPHVILLGPDQAFDEEELALEASRRLGYRPEVLRYPVRESFSGGLRSSSDLAREACRSQPGVA
ncbi:MAG: DUF357 domain-containing protein [Acidilobaceae archaeon]